MCRKDLRKRQKRRKGKEEKKNSTTQDRKDLEKALAAANGKIVGTAVLSAPSGVITRGINTHTYLHLHSTIHISYICI